jgi:hypothetical protein
MTYSTSELGVSDCMTHIPQKAMYVAGSVKRNCILRHHDAADAALTWLNGSVQESAWLLVTPGLLLQYLNHNIIVPAVFHCIKLMLPSVHTTSCAFSSKCLLLLHQQGAAQCAEHEKKHACTQHQHSQHAPTHCAATTAARLGARWPLLLLPPGCPL